MASTRARAVEAAIDLLGAEGLRSLTHGRVDQRAGLPKGSTSNYFRTRQALLIGVVDGILERELPEVGGALALDSPTALVDAVCAAWEQISTVDRKASTARLVLFLEASHNPELRDALTRGRATMEALGVVALARLGARDPHTAAAAMAACFEGLLLHRIARDDRTDPRPMISLIVQAALADPRGGPDLAS